MGSSGGSKVSYVQSPEQRQVSQLAMPTIQKLGDVGSGAAPASSLYDIPAYPNAPTMPSAQEIGMPDINSIMPTKQWWNSLSPEVLQGIYAPYEATAQKMMEGMGFNGQVGSAEGGYSGAAGAAMGKFAAESAPQIGLQAWNMSAPALNKQWEAQYGQRLMDYQNTLNQKTTDYQGSVASYQNNLNRNMMPYTTLPGMMQGTYPNPVVEQGKSSNSASYATGAVAGAAAAAAYSDERLKDIGGAYSDGLNKINDIIPISFTWKNDGIKEFGLSAQNVLASIPDAVTQDKEGYLMIKILPMIAMLVNSVKELKNEIDTLKRGTNARQN